MIGKKKKNQQQANQQPKNEVNLPEMNQTIQHDPGRNPVNQRNRFENQMVDIGNRLPVSPNIKDISVDGNASM